VVATANGVAGQNGTVSYPAPPFKLVRPLGTMEDYIASYNERGLGDIVYALHLKSKVVVPDEAVIRSLRYWQT
jgi:hypothetical protein